MKEKIQMILGNIFLLLADMGGAHITSSMLEKILGATVHAVTAIVITVIGGSLLFLLQKTLLPKISAWINTKMKW